jgi:hypothetical protein
VSPVVAFRHLPLPLSCRHASSFFLSYAFLFGFNAPGNHELLNVALSFVSSFHKEVSSIFLLCLAPV